MLRVPHAGLHPELRRAHRRPRPASAGGRRGSTRRCRRARPAAAAGAIRGTAPRPATAAPGPSARWWMRVRSPYRPTSRPRAAAPASAAAAWARSPGSTTGPGALTDTTASTPAPRCSAACRNTTEPPIENPTVATRACPSSRAHDDRRRQVQHLPVPDRGAPARRAVPAEGERDDGAPPRERPRRPPHVRPVRVPRESVRDHEHQVAGSVNPRFRTQRDPGRTRNRSHPVRVRRYLRKGGRRSSRRAPRHASRNADERWIAPHDLPNRCSCRLFCCGRGLGQRSPRVLSCFRKRCIRGGKPQVYGPSGRSTEAVAAYVLAGTEEEPDV
ncbi:hypothetical protein SVIOM74S_03026 [Streptomyces violarus]